MEAEALLETFPPRASACWQPVLLQALEAQLVDEQANAVRIAGGGGSNPLRVRDPALAANLTLQAHSRVRMNACGRRAAVMITGVQVVGDMM